MNSLRQAGQPARVNPRQIDPVFRRKPIANALAGLFAAAAVCLPGGVLAGGAPTPGARISPVAVPSGPAGQPTVATINGRTIVAPQMVSGSFGDDSAGTRRYVVVQNTDGSVVGTITQTSNAGILQWNSFDIGSNSTINIVQPSSTAVLLNKISDGDYNHSTLIEGKLNANGQVYLYNPNGIIFGKSSQVSVNSLVATSLKISDSRFLAGLISSDSAAFAADPSVQYAYVDADGNLGTLPGNVVIEGDASGQAHIAAANGGKILLVAPTITNDGALSAPDGQVLLTGGRAVYLSKPKDTRMRGLTAGVNNDAIGPIAAGTSAVTNGDFGKIDVGTGNATLIAKAVNQNGRISATTTVTENGSIYLIARDGAKEGQGQFNIKTASGAVKYNTSFNNNINGGDLSFGANSVTEIKAALGDKTTTSASFNPSLIYASGKTVRLAGDGAGHGAQIVAPGGDVVVNAIAVAANGDGSPTANQKGSGASVTIESGATIDVSGTTSTELAMESNVIAVELRGTELADNTLLRNSAIRGKTAYVDIRDGNLKIANISGWLDLVEHNVGQSTAKGGSVSLTADDAVNVSAGAKIDVSGGYVTYLPGYVLTSQLLWNGRLFDIASAPADRVYTGLTTATAGPRSYEAGYIQSADAGTVAIDAPTIALDGALVGKVTTGTKQRDVTSQPLGGQLKIGSYDTDTKNYGLFQDALTLGAGTSGLVLDTDALSANGFSRLALYTSGDITINRATQLSAGAALSLRSGQDIDLAADVRTPAGTVAITADHTLSVEDGVALNVAGTWTNDQVFGASEVDAAGNHTTPIITKGGSITLIGTSVALGANANLDASGGAWLSSSGVLASGSGGSISVSSSTKADTGALTLGDGVRFQAYGVSSGGKLTLSADNVDIGGTASDALTLDAGFFQTGGFSSYDVRAAGNLTVLAGTTIAPRTDNWTLTRTSKTTASGAMDDAFTITTLPLTGKTTRSAAKLSLTALTTDDENYGRLDLQAGASIVADPGASVALKAGRQLTVDGTIRAPGGTIALTLTPALGELGGLSYFADRSLWVGATAVLDASGSTAGLWQDNTGLTKGSVLDGGTIAIGHYETDSNALYAAPGYVVIEKGAVLDVSGTSATMTLPVSSRGGRETRTVASAGGSIDIRAREGLVVDGTLKGAGGNASAAGGSLSLALDREAKSGSASFPTIARTLTVFANDTDFPALAGSNRALTGWEGQGFVSAATLNNGGFDWVTLKSQDNLSFDLGAGDLSLQARAGLRLDAPVIGAAHATTGASVTLAAPYVALGNSDWRYQSSIPAASASSVGDVALKVDAGTVDLVGQSALSGFDDAAIVASGDIRLIGVVPIDLSKAPSATTLPSLAATGGFSVAGSMTLTSAQAYPTSLSQFTLTATDDVVFASNGGTASAPLSAGGSLMVNAANITQDGTVRAPLGQIVFNATGTLSYGAGSLTSVAGGQTMPLGFVQNGLDWLYDFGNGNAVNLSDSTATNYYALPDKRIVSQAPTVVFSQGAVQDLSGGGDLYAYQFTAGTGGSTDVLATTNTSSTATVFAILPGYSSAIAPSDFQYGQSGGLKVGDRVYLSGIPGVAAGYYTLLPAHYALLPGAYSITAVANTTDMASTANVAKLNGSWLVAGYRSSLGGGADSRWSGFLVKSATVVRNESEFADYSGSKFLSSLASSPVDGGHVVFDVSKSLTLNGTVHLAAAAGGDNGIADISAPKIAIVESASSALPDGTDADTLKLAAEDLIAMGADSLLIGGVRTVTADEDAIRVGADTVTMGSDASHPTLLTGPEVILAANDTVRVNAGSAIKATGTLNRAPRDMLVTDTSNPTSGADGALLRVSNGAATTLDRNHTTEDGTLSAPAGTRGTLDIAADATIAANGSALLDATKTTTLSGRLDLVQGAALGLGASRISLGSDAPTNVDGLRFDDAALTQLSSLAALALTSYSTFDLYGAVQLGSTTLQTLTFAGGGMRAAGAAPVEAKFTAQTIRFAQAGTDSAAAGAGNATFTAKNIEVGSGNFGLHFASATLDASNDIRAAGTKGALMADGDLRLAAARITTDTGADAAFTAGGALTLTHGSGAVGDLAAAELGGALTFKGATITSDANIVASSGTIKLESGNGVQVTGGEISTAGAALNYGSTVVHTAGGNIGLDGGNGDVDVASGATLDVSATGADAGALKIAATSGKATLDGSLKGSTSDRSTDHGGSFVLDVATLDAGTGFGALNAKLNDGGFTEARNFRVRNGNVALLATDAAITAHAVAIAADNGNIDIAGTIDASGSKGGSIALYAGEASAGTEQGNVHLAGTARLLAHATTAATSADGSTGDGGSIALGSSTADGSAPTSTAGDASLQIDNGALLKVGGLGAGQNGTVLLRAPRLDDNTEVAIAGLDASSIVGSRATTIEAYQVYSGYSNISANADSTSNLKVANTDGSAATTAKLYRETAAFMSNASAIAARLGIDDASVVITPGVEVRSDGDLTVSVNEASSSKGNRGWNLDTWRFGYAAADGSTVTAPGALTLRATGDLLIKGSISDGFTKTSASVAMPDWSIDTSGNASWSYRLIGGADQAAANSLAVLADQGSVKLTFARTKYSSTDVPVATVRTGTGNIDVAAGTNVLLDTLDWADGSTTGTVLDGDFSAITSTDSLTGATLYTAGKATGLTSTIANTNNALYGSSTRTGAAFTNNGGAITVTAHDDVIGPVTNQMIDNWLFRQGRSYVDASGNTVFDAKSGVVQSTALWSRFDYFDQGIATFGGGDIAITAETGDVNNVSASVASNGRYVQTNSTCASPCTSAAAYTWVAQGGGDLSVSAGRDIRGGSFYVQTGDARLHAEGSIVRGDHVVLNDASAPIYLAPVLAAGDAQFDVTAGHDLTISGVINPTLTAQSLKNTTQSQGDMASPVTNVNTLANQASAYLSYAADAAVTLTALAGNLTLEADQNALYNAGGGNLVSSPELGLYSLMPGTVRARALGGDLTIKSGFALAPSASGQLELFARDNVWLDGADPIVMLDNDPAALGSTRTPWYGPALNTLVQSINDMEPAGTDAHAPTAQGLHGEDSAPARVVALNADVQGLSTSIATLVLPKHAEISAGRDIVNLGFDIQQLAATDVTTVTAGRDIKNTTLVAGGNSATQRVTGPGRIDFVAGRNFDLGNSQGVITKGNLDNPYLPEAGASITVTAGASADYANFAQHYVAKLADLSAASQALLLADMQALQPTLGNDIDAAWAAFNQLSGSSRKAILNDLFYEKIAEVTGAKGSASLDLNAFDQVIASLFPSSGLTGGNINVFGSQLKTQRGGSITMFAPAGSVYAGLTSIPAYLASRKKASDLGIFTIAGGAINALVKNDFSVNLGRVFTLGGGDITLVSQYGNIDAGKGAKTSQATPPPLITTDPQGNTVVDISASIAGSGIGTLRTNPSVPAASVYPIAPRGIFDAGDAGVRSTGSVNIVAQTVLNGNNISAAGAITGARSADTTGLGAAASAPTNPTTTKTSDLVANAANEATAGSLNVELLGYGTDGQKPVTHDGQNDPCADSTESDDARKKKRSPQPASSACPR